jgi:ribosomal protein S13
MQLKPKKRENIPYLIEKIKKKNIISGLTRVIGTRFLHGSGLCKKLGFPEHKSEKILNLTEPQRKIYDFTLNKYNFLYEEKDREEVLCRGLLNSINCYRDWRFMHGLPCRGQRTKTNASTAQTRIRPKNTPDIIKKENLKSKKKFMKKFNEISKRPSDRAY